MVLAAGEQLACHLDVTGVPGTVGQLIGAGGVLAGCRSRTATGHLVLDASVAVRVRRAPRYAVPPRAGRPDVGPSPFMPMVALTNPIFCGV